MPLKEEILKAIEEMGFTEATSIQDQAIPLLSTKATDFIGLAQTGTGKTAAFGLPLLHRIDTTIRGPQALIICSTRELCTQITQEIQRFAKFQKGMSVIAIYGGTSIQDQLYNLKRGVQIVVGTPGRLMDLIERKALLLEGIQTVVLDEADEMLNMGFQEDIDTILSKTPKQKNIWLFSATMSSQIEGITKKYMQNPEKITVGSRNSSSKTIEHQYCIVRYENAYPALRRFIDFYPDMYGMLFCRTKKETAEIAEKLIKDGYAVDTIHGDLSQNQREAVMKKFREKSIKLLIATDVAARGIDVSDITHVFHYNFPQDIENYTHRSGRTGRAGKSGISIAILNTREARQVSFLERQIGSPITYTRVPSGADICEKQLYHFINTVRNVEVKEEAISRYLSKIQDEFKDISKEDLLTKLVSLEFNTFLHIYEKASDINADMHRGGDSQSFGSPKGPRVHDDRGKFTDIKINVGKSNGVEIGSLINYICRNAGIKSSVLGKISLMPNESYVGVSTELAQKVAKKLVGTEFRQTAIKPEVLGEGAVPPQATRDRGHYKKKKRY